jgi:RNA polymerase sigma-70 factor (ECF subfamily)
MNADLADSLLVKLASGDDAAAEQVFRTYEPYLRIIVRRQLSAALRARFDSLDVVQSVWADLVRGFRESRWHFPDARRFRAFLIKMTRNRFLDRVRRYQQALAHEQPLPEGNGQELAADSQPGPSEVVQAQELWERMLQLCPPAHRELLRLKREGLSLEEIAARTGLHPGSIRRILYDLARRLASRTPASSRSGTAPVTADGKDIPPLMPRLE